MNLKLFEKQQYINLETFRKSGVGVKIPVWFAQDGNALVIWTEVNSGKAKRIRNNGKVRIVPSSASGVPSGEWVDAQAQADDSAEATSRAANLIRQKYGFMFNFFALMGKLRKAKHTAIKVW
jgi:PPOX class probable F420-dependent enzyme